MIAKVKNQGGTFEYTPECQSAVAKIKHALTSDPLLKGPEVDKPFIIHCDASAVAIGAVLLQVNSEGKKQPVAYFSRTLNKHEKNTSVYDREALAAVEACQQFRCYIYGNAIKPVIQTDHISLTFLTHKENLSPKMQRWAISLQEFEPTITFKEGKHNIDADALSRSSTTTANVKTLAASAAEDVTQAASVVDDTVTQQANNTLIHQVISNQQYDEKCCTISKKLSLMNNEQKEDDLLSKERHYILQNGILYKSVTRNNKTILLLVVPLSLRQQILRQCHDDVFSGHNGIKATEDRLRDRFYWEGFSADIEKYVKACEICSARKVISNPKVPVQSMPVPSEPFQIIGTDITGPFNKTKDGNESILTIIDYFTGFLWAFPIKDMSTETMLEKFIKFFSDHEPPQVIISDRGSNFASELAHAVYALHDIHKIQTTAFHPQTNGRVERAHKGLVDKLACLVKEQPNQEWDKLLDYAVSAANSTKNEISNNSPYYVLYGRNKRMPIDLELYQAEPNLKDKTHTSEETYVNNILSNMQQARKVIIGNRNDINDKRDSEPLEWKFRVGSTVMKKIRYRTRGQWHKLEDRYVGPFEVVAEMGPTVRRIRSLTSAKTKFGTINVLELKEVQAPSKHHKIKIPNIKKKNHQPIVGQDQNQQESAAVAESHASPSVPKIIEIKDKDNSKRVMIIEPQEEKKDMDHDNLNKYRKERQNKNDYEIVPKSDKRMEQNVTLRDTWQLHAPADIVWDKDENKIINEQEAINRLREAYITDKNLSVRDLEQLKNVPIKGEEHRNRKQRIQRLTHNERMKLIAQELMKQYSGIAPSNNEKEEAPALKRTSPRLQKKQDSGSLEP